MAMRAAMRVGLLLLISTATDVATPEALDQLYLGRDLPGTDEALGLLERAVEGQARVEYAVAWRIARHHCWLAQAAGPGERRTARIQACRRWADRAAAIEPEGGEAAYCQALAVGLMAQDGGVLQAIAMGAADRFEERLRVAIRTVPGLNHGAARVAYARFLHRAPWPRGDLRKAEDLYRAVLDRWPENLRARAYLAELLAETGRDEAARSAASEILTASIQYDPPDGRAARELAKGLLRRLR